MTFPTSTSQSNVLTIPARSILLIEYVIVGYGGGDIAAFQFNGDTTAANYGTWYWIGSNAGSPVSTGVSNAGTLSSIGLSSVAQTVGRSGSITISNLAASRKVARITTVNESTTSTGPSLENGWGEWLNTSAQITTIKMLSQSANTILAGSFFIVYGDNP